jgi:[ribosomal protein S5]-alanine N-acetyltransferase
MIQAKNLSFCMKKVLPKLESSRTILRLAEPDEVAAIIDYYISNRDHLAPFEPIRQKIFYTETYWYKEVKTHLDAFNADQSLKLFLFEKEHSKVIIGSINFANFVRGAFQSCTLGYSVAVAFEGKGYMSEALKVAINYVFSELNLHRIMAAYLTHNQRSALLLKRLGFLVEGYVRDYLMINGQWQDHVLTSLINYKWHL